MVENCHETFCDIFRRPSHLGCSYQPFHECRQHQLPRYSNILQARPLSWPGEVAEKLHEFGVEPGDKVAVIGYAFDSFWARLARVKIVAEMLGAEADPFWVGGPEIQDKTLRSIASTGTKAVIAEYVPRYASIEGWHRVGISNFYVYIFK
jgi:hypothetical protein